MEFLSWEMSVFLKAIHFKNLTNASQSLSLSQPQLSRIIKKLEDELDIKLLNRESKRNSAWSKEAHDLSKVMTSNNTKLELEIQSLRAGHKMTYLRIGLLEGLIESVVPHFHQLFKSFSTIEADIFDLNELEHNFLNEKLDLIFTSRLPGKKKYSHEKIIGYQSLERQGNGGIPVYSLYEKGSMKEKNLKPPYLVSNSLALRSSWIVKKKGNGILPSSLGEKSSSKNQPIYLLVREGLGKDFIENIELVIK